MPLAGFGPLDCEGGSFDSRAVPALELQATRRTSNGSVDIHLVRSTSGDLTSKRAYGKNRSDLFDRCINETWLADGAKRFEQRLREKTEKVMQHQPAPLPEDIVQEMGRMAQHWQ